jgi:L-aspartate oxidase
VGIVRNRDGILGAIERLEEISAFVEEFAGYYRIKLKMAVDVSLLIARSALVREESRGVHIRDDFPDENKKWENHIVMKKGEEPFLSPI